MTKSIVIDYWDRGVPGTRTVIADVSGPLAIHEMPNARGAYSLTHVPTGWAVHLGLRRNQARRLRTLVADLDWRFTSPKSRKLKTLREPVRRAVAAVTKGAR